ncbi:heme/hemin ABC transporter substrate-binding protein [Martelella soudanensis]|uniref:heme/hemin ABC transporter substrate-binding protein n=1 Tax=unclassified Martelella TaxID=2629616 RepID=UPI0015DECAF4|nr:MULTISPECIES: ABC transporter substrate-binding protein [unclassified Martelella]
MTADFLSRPLAAILLLAGATSAGATEPLADTSRLVTIGGSVTEIVYALGAGDDIVGRDTTSAYPPEAAAKPDIGYMRQLSPEGVLSIDPSAIITIEGAGPPETLDVLKQADVEMAVVPEDYSRDGILEKVETVGALLGRQTEAVALAADIKAKLDPLLAANEARPEAERKSALFILSLNGGKVMGSGTGTAANGMIEAAGLDNAIGDFPGYKALSDEAIIKAAPDVIILMGGPNGSHAPGNDDIAANPALSLTPAGEAMAIYRIDPVGMLNFGPRFAENLAALTTEIYGD